MKQQVPYTLRNAEPEYNCEVLLDGAQGIRIAYWPSFGDYSLTVSWLRKCPYFPTAAAALRFAAELATNRPVS